MTQKIALRFLAATALAAFISLGLASGISAQTNQQLREAFQNLRNDNVRYNCSRAAYWLYKRRESLRDQIREELYLTNDAQERDVLLDLLFLTDSFVPDERFARFVVNRLREEDTRAGGAWCVVPSSDLGNDEEPADFNKGAHHLAWEYIDRHYDLFEPLLKDEIGQTTDVWELWAIAWMFKKHNVLSANARLYTDPVLGLVATALKNDDVPWNASEAMRLFLMLPKQSTPIVRAVSNSSDSQQRYLARAYLDALRGSKNAVGYLNAKLKLYTGLLPGSDRPEPDWVGPLTEPYVDKDGYP